MSGTLSIPVLAQLALSCPSSNEVPRDRILDHVVAIAQAESGRQVTSLHDNTADRSYAPTTIAEAAVLVDALHAQGHSLDAGVMQINDANWPRFGLTSVSVFDPRANVCAGMAVLAEAYATERRVSCRYNTGQPDCTNGYPERVARALHQVHLESAAVARAPITALEQATSPPPADPFVQHAPARELTFAPAFLAAAHSRDSLRPAAPAAPASLAAPPDGRGSFPQKRSSNP